jgi:hypothetical protein
LHCGFGEAGDLSFETLFDRCRLLRLGEISVRALSEEDHFRFLAVHLLRHGAYRPLWLCDIGAAIENAGPGFDWNVCLESSKQISDWVAVTIALARDLLGADMTNAPSETRKKRLPRWLIDNVLDKWAEPFASRQAANRHRAPMASYLRRPRGLIRDLRNRWPDPLVATIGVNGPLNELPRLPFQIANVAQRTAKFIKGL